MKQQSTKLLFWIAFSFLIVGVAEGYLPGKSDDPGLLYVPHTILVAFLIYFWCKNHARENNIGSPGSYPFFSAVFPLLGVPVYFFKFFGFRNGGIKVLKSLGFAIITGVVYLLPYIMIRN